MGGKKFPTTLKLRLAGPPTLEDFLVSDRHATPRVFGKCAQAHEKGRVRVILGEAVCEKCSEAIEKTSLAESQFVKRVCDPSRKTFGAMGRIPPPPRNSDDYQKRGVAGGAICTIVKTKGM